ncbi:reverse transcriptase domain-containing protein [Tanacetum coccineum]|uniref:Reverse transcriptase domain-containing protein n=1 Tax=Tanacetum coccineum TaxID=301880 RepID=A0ABQ5CB93_9ASTR
MELNPEVDKVRQGCFPTNNGSTKDVQPLVVQVQSQIPNSEPVVMPNLKPSIPYPSRCNDEKQREKANDQVEKFYKIFQDMSFKISLVDALILMPKFTSTLKALIGNKEKLSEMARTPLNEHCSMVILNKLSGKLGDPGKFLIPCDFPGMDECLALADLGASINLKPLSVWKKLSLPELTLTCMTLELANRSITKPIGIAEDVYLKVGKFKFPADFVVVDFDADPRVHLILGRSFLKTGRALIDWIFSSEEVNAFLALEDDLTSPEVDDSYYDPKGDILLLESFLNDDASPPPNQENYLPKIRKELKVCVAKTDKSSIDEPPEVELKDIHHPHLEYVFLEGDNKLPVIIAKDLSVEEKAALIKVLKSHKRAIAWKLSDIKGINLEFCTHKILMEEDYKPAIQHQIQVNPKIHNVIKKEVEKPLDAGLIYPISDSPLGQECFKGAKDTTLCLNWEKSHLSVYGSLCPKISLCKKKDSKARLLWWVLLLQEFNFNVIDTKGAENLVADHLSQLENPYENVLNPKEVNEKFPLETINMVTSRSDSSTPWFADYANYHAGNFIVKGMSS